MSAALSSPSRSTAPDARSNALCLGLALLIALGSALPLLIGVGLVNTRAGGDSPFLIQRTQQLAENLRAGTFPAHWMPDGAYGLGYPFYVFYASLPYYLAAGLHLAGCGLLWSIKLTQALGFLLAGLMMYLLARRFGARPGAALLSSAVYTCAPYHLVNVYVRGDALSEFYALALYPLILWTLVRLVERPAPGRMAALAASYALLAVCHNISVLIFSPLVGLWLLVTALARGKNKRWRALGMGAGALVLGLALSAWFWLPALREQSLVQLQDQTTGYFNYANHFLRANLLQGTLVHNYTINAQRTPFSAGLVQALLGLLGIVALVVRAVAQRGRNAQPMCEAGTTDSPARTAPWLAIATLLLYTWLMTPSSEWIWEHVPLLPMVQFPWRLLGVQALAIAILAAHIPALYGERLWPTLVLVAACAVSGLAGLQVDRLPLNEADISPQQLMLYETFSGNIGSTVRNEYLPADMLPRPYTSAVQLAANETPLPLALEGSLASAELLSRQAERQEWRIRVDAPALLAFHTTFYPGWEATVDGAAQGVEPLKGLGLVGLRLQPGDHHVVLHFEATPTRRYALWVSLAALAACAAAAFSGLWQPQAARPRRARPRGWRAPVLAGGAVLLATAAWWVLAPLTRDARALTGPRVMDSARAPYLHSEPDGVVFGQALLEGYDYGAEPVAPGSPLHITVRWQAPQPDHVVTVRWVAATAHLLAPAPVWAQASAPIDASTVTLTLDLPSDLPPGLYVPTLSVSAGGADQPASTVTGVGMGTLTLEPVTVRAFRVASGRETALAGFGPENVPPVISLLQVRSAMDQPGGVEVALSWRCERQAPLNYMLSLRLKDALGATLVSRDLPPLLGCYPTSLWRPGELVTDRVLLTLPQRRALQPDDQIEIVLYDRLTLQAVGTVSVRVGDTM